MMKVSAVLLALMPLTASAACTPVVTKPDLNLTEWVRRTWYTQEQQITGYLQPDQFFCVTATYNEENTKVPFFGGNVIAVHNYDNVGGVGKPSDNANNKTVLCARQPDSKDNAKLLVAPCFLPNALSGNYWILGAGPSSDNYQWAAVTAGQPTVQYDDGCTTKTSGTNGAGLWIFSRDQIMPNEYLEDAKKVLKQQGFTLSQLQKVPQEGCTYEGAFIKP